MLLLSSVDRVPVALLLSRYGLNLALIAPDETIPGSYWGESEAGLREALAAAPEGKLKAALLALGRGVLRQARATKAGPAAD